MLILNLVYLNAETITVNNSDGLNAIKQAIAIAQSGDKIIIENGIYYESNIIVDKKLHIEGREKTIIDGNNSKANEIFIVQSDSVIIEKLQIQNLGPSFVKDLAAIRIKRKKDFRIENNTILGTMFAIYLEYAEDGIVRNNLITGKESNVLSAGNGIHAWTCNNIEISGNTIKNQRDGIYFEFVNNSKIFDNECSDNLRYGLHFMFSNDDEYNNNIFTNNNAGVAVMFSKNIIMNNNQFYNNWGGSSYGLLLKEIYDAEIFDNYFHKNSIGIRVEGSSRVVYRNNDFISNGWGIKIAGGCYENTIFSNNFISNSFDLAIESSVNSNSFDGNYWSRNNGYDLNNDGIADEPYRPVELYNYIVTKTPEATILLRSIFLSEKVTPIFTPKNVLDNAPLMNRISFTWHS